MPNNVYKEPDAGDVYPLADRLGVRRPRHHEIKDYFWISCINALLDRIEKLEKEKDAKA